ncbi:hypothetical protein GIB67_007872 [Kingdonia uniflora]|uniref:Translation initiation factor IF-3 n=1 Tax=Kingdonia uniflora TaxID=39325 RepID=A0A7J7PAN5_9MAGN|nr:hypothetical protein GIB67_007872 [Kingdonia uniflora]
MAGITTTSSSFTFKPISFSTKSELFGVRLTNNPNFIKFDSSRSVLSVSIIARFGGSRPSSGGARRSREFRKVEVEEDPALDIASIRSTTVRLIDAQQNMIGVVPKSEALQIATDAELDLVILSPDADPPVVKIMDYNKYRYEQQKKKREQQKKSVSTRMDMKELKMGYNIDSHDYSVRFRAAQKFLKDGDKVKVIVQLKGREKDFRSNAIELIKRFQTELGELATEESKNFREKNIFIVLVPSKVILQKAPDQPKKKEKAETTEAEEVTQEVEGVTEVTSEVSAGI